MYNCRVCKFATRSIKYINQHYYKHRNLPNITFKCYICFQRFSNVKTFLTHNYRNHKTVKDYILEDEKNLEIVCTNCDLSFSNKKTYILHTPIHFKNNENVTCNINNCKNVYGNINSLRVHVSRYHKFMNGGSNHNVNDPNSDVDQNDEQNYSANLSEHFVNTSSSKNQTIHSSVIPDIENDEFTKMFATFLVMLEAKHLIPQRTISCIIENFADITSTSNTASFQKIENSIKDLSADERKLALEILDKTKDCFEKNSFLKSVGRDGPLRSQYKRNVYYKNHFNYIAPIQILLGKNEINKMCYAHYIPIKSTLQALLEKPEIRDNLLGHVPSTSSALKSIRDGYMYKNNFGDGEYVVNLILYQDAFEPCNALGSSKGKHKILSFYYMLDIQNRSKIDSIQLLFLCNDKDTKQFSQEVLFRTLINDIKSLQKSGVSVPGFLHKFKVNFVCLSGDNLGSHFIGGFSENFSNTQFFCRYCYKTLDLFRSEPFVSAKLRTYQEYCICANTFKETANLKESQGVKFNSIFNEIENFNVVMPGLPPCLGHDIFEGVAKYDIPLIVNYFIKNNWFTESYLNFEMKKLYTKISDCTYIPYKYKCKVLPGHGMQNMYFTILLPLALETKIKEVEDNSWKMIVFLTRSIRIIMSDEIELYETCFLESLINDYISFRLQAFPDINLRPKHHYAQHYGELIRAFGPLLNVWTFRFESKHKYFKNVVRRSMNFTSLIKSLAEKHQLLQAYYGEGKFFNEKIEAAVNQKINIELLDTKTKKNILDNQFLNLNHKNFFFTNKVSYFGKCLKIKGAVVISYNDDDNICKSLIIKNILVDYNYEKLFLLGNVMCA